MLMFWLRYSFRTKWTNVTDESNTDHGEGMKSTVIYTASVNLLSFLFSPFFSFSNIIFVFFFAFLFLLTPILVSSLSTSVLFSTLMMTMTTIFSTTTTIFTMYAYSLQHLILRWASTDVYERVWASTRLFDCSFFLYIVCVYVCVYIYISCISCSDWPK